MVTAATKIDEMLRLFNVKVSIDRGVLHFPPDTSQGRYFVNRYKRYIPIIALVLAGLGVSLEKYGIDLEALTGGGSVSQQGQSNNGQSKSLSGGKSSHPTSKQWSSTKPEINQWHVFDGEINRSGKPTGYHSRPGGIDAGNARVVSINDKPNRAGVYTAKVEVRDGNQWKTKNSSFFPDSLSQGEVIDAVLNAYKNNKNSNGDKFSGPSGLGFTIEGWTTNRGGINTAYPVFRRNQ